jgi:DNA-binding beta-propeller fold protein YncE
VVQIVYGPSPLDRFQRPLGMTVDRARGLLVVADTGNHRLVVVDAKGRSRGGIPCVASASEGRSCEPRAVACDAGGRLYAVGTLTRGIEIISPTGARLARLDPLPPQHTTDAIQGVAVAPSGRIWVTIAGTHSAIVALRSDGTTDLRIERAGSAALGSLGGIAVNADETLIAAVSTDAERPISVFRTDGTYVASFGKRGEGEGTFSRPTHLAWGVGNTLWVVDTLRGSISVFDAKGDYRGRIGGFGRGPGQFSYPVACAFLADDRLAVLERAGARIQVLEIEMAENPELRPGRAPTGSDATAVGARPELRR